MQKSELQADSTKTFRVYHDPEIGRFIQLIPIIGKFCNGKRVELKPYQYAN